MEISIIILYLLNIFLSRWVNLKAFEKYDVPKVSFLWFVPMSPFSFLIIIIIHKFHSLNNNR